MTHPPYPCTYGVVADNDVLLPIGVRMLMFYRAVPFIAFTTMCALVYTVVL